MNFAKIFGVLVAFVTVGAVSALADQPNYESLQAAVQDSTSQLPDEIIALFRHTPDGSESLNPAPAALSAYSLLNHSEGNYAVSIDGIHSVLVALNLGAQGKTRLVIDEKTKPDITVQTPTLNSKKGYTNIVSIISEQEFNSEFRDQVQNPKARLGVCIRGSVVESVNRLNKYIGEKWGLPDAIPEPTYDPRQVLIASVAVQETGWLQNANPEDIKLNWNGDKRVSGVNFGTEMAVGQAPNGAKTYHFRMDNDVVLSIVFVEDLDENGVGEWLPRSCPQSGWKKARVEMPVFSLETRIDLEKEPDWKFMFDENEASFSFTESDDLHVQAAGEKIKLTFDLNGLSAKAITYALLTLKGIPFADFAVDKPFVCCVSYSDDRDGGVEQMPTFAFRVVDPE